MVQSKCPFEERLRRRMISGGDLDAELMAHVVNCPTCSELFSLKYDNSPVFILSAKGKQMAVHLFELVKRWQAGNLFPLLNPEPTVLGEGEFVLCRSEIQLDDVPGVFEFAIKVEDADFSMVRIRWQPGKAAGSGKDNAEFRLWLVDSDRGEVDRLVSLSKPAIWRVRNQKEYEIQIETVSSGRQLLLPVDIRELGSLDFTLLSWEEKLALFTYLVRLHIPESAPGYPARLLQNVREGSGRELIVSELGLWVREFGSQYKAGSLPTLVEVMLND